MRLRSVAILAGLTTAAVHAATIFTVTGSPVVFSDLMQVVGFHVSSTWLNVSITMPLVDPSSGGPIAGVEGTVYLMNFVGPGATTANQVAPPVSVFGLSGSFSLRTLFTGLTLQPGNYYLVVLSARAQVANLSLSSQGTNPPKFVTTGTAVTDLGSAVTSSLAAYPPASNLGSLSTPADIAITVTGDPAPPGVPVPPSLILALAAIAGFGVYQRLLRRPPAQS